MTMRNETPPPVELFTRPPGRDTWATQMLRSMTPLEPKRLPDAHCSKQSAKTLRETAKRAGLTVAVRTFEGRQWACLMGADS